MINTEDPNDGFFDQAWVIRTIQWGLIVVCLLLVLAEFAYEHHHPHFELETKFGFQAWLGFGAFVGAVALGSLLRLVVARPEDYYEHGDVPKIQTSADESHVGEDHH